MTASHERKGRPACLISLKVIESVACAPDRVLDMVHYVVLDGEHVVLEVAAAGESKG